MGRRDLARKMFSKPGLVSQLFKAPLYPSLPTCSVKGAPGPQSWFWSALSSVRALLSISVSLEFPYSFLGFFAHL